MRITIGNMIRICDPSPEVAAWCRENLEIANPEYGKKLRMHKWIGGTPEKLVLYETDGSELILPYGCLRALLKMTGEGDSFKNLIPLPKMVWFDCDIPLYDYQKEAVAFTVEAEYGILQAPAGSGKTQMGIAIAAALGRKTLWLTHTRDLLNQSKERAERYMNANLIGTITEGKAEIGKGITFATVQTLCKLDLMKYGGMWDTVIVDECHRVAGTPTAMTQFSKVLNSLAARHKYGLSATVHRSDGMIAATYALLGDIVWTVPESAVAGRIMRVRILPRPTETGLEKEYLDTDGTILYSKLISGLSENFERNRLILNDLSENEGHYNLILSDRLEHLRYLMKYLPKELREQAVMIDGSMVSKKAKKERAQALEDLREGRKRYLFATFSLAKEGLDIPRLDRLYLTTPQKDYAVVAQSVGRIARVSEGKEEPVVYDYVDERIQYLVRAYKKRCTTYRKLGCIIT